MDVFDFARFLIENGERLTLVVVLILLLLAGGVAFARGVIASPDEVARLRNDCDAKDAAISKASAEFGDSRVTLARAEVAMKYQSERIAELEKDRDACRQLLQRKELEVEIRQGLLRNPAPEPETP